MVIGVCFDGCEGGWIGECCDIGILYYMVDKMY